MYSFARFHWLKNLEWMGLSPSSEGLVVACNLTMEKSVVKPEVFRKELLQDLIMDLDMGVREKKDLRMTPQAHILGYLVLLIVTNAFYDVVIQ